MTTDRPWGEAEAKRIAGDRWPTYLYDRSEVIHIADAVARESRAEARTQVQEADRQLADAVIARREADQRIAELEAGLIAQTRIVHDMTHDQPGTPMPSDGAWHSCSHAACWNARAILARTRQEEPVSEQMPYYAATDANDTIPPQPDRAGEPEGEYSYPASVVRRRREAFDALVAALVRVQGEMRDHYTGERFLSRDTRQTVDAALKLVKEVSAV